MFLKTHKNTNIKQNRDTEWRLSYFVNSHVKLKNHKENNNDILHGLNLLWITKRAITFVM